MNCSSAVSAVYGKNIWPCFICQHYNSPIASALGRAKPFSFTWNFAECMHIYSCYSLNSFTWPGGCTNSSVLVLFCRGRVISSKAVYFICSESLPSELCNSCFLNPKCPFNLLIIITRETTVQVPRDTPNNFTVSEETLNFWHIMLSMLYLLSHSSIQAQKGLTVVSNLSHIKIHNADHSLYSHLWGSSVQRQSCISRLHC